MVILLLHRVEQLRQDHIPFTDDEVCHDVDFSIPLSGEDSRGRAWGSRRELGLREKSEV